MIQRVWMMVQPYISYLMHDIDTFITSMIWTFNITGGVPQCEDFTLRDSCHQKNTAHMDTVNDVPSPKPHPTHIDLDVTLLYEEDDSWYMLHMATNKKKLVTLQTMAIRMVTYGQHCLKSSLSFTKQDAHTSLQNYENNTTCSTWFLL